LGIVYWEEAMHEPVLGRLEDYLGGDGHFPDVEAHLKRCESCRMEVSAMQEQAVLLRSLKPVRKVEPDPAFYARVLNRIETQTRPSVWSLFGESLFARRLAYASTAFLVLLGTFLVSSTTEMQDQNVVASSPERILAGDDVQAPPITMENPQRDREVVLVNLATYQQDYQ